MTAQVPYQAIEFTSYTGGSIALDEILKVVKHVKKTTLPHFGDDEVLVQVTATPVNPCDLLIIAGMVPPKDGPSISGVEGAGKIVALGKNVTEFKVGDRVYMNGFAFFSDWTKRVGLWSEFVACPSTGCYLIPDSVDDLTASQFFVNPGSAYIMMKDILNIHAGAWVLVTAAGSNLSYNLVELSRVFNYNIISIVRPREHTDVYTDADHVKLLSSRGFGHVLVFDNKNEDQVIQEILKITKGKGVDCALDCVGGTSGLLCLKALKKTGTLLFYGTMNVEGINLDFSRYLDMILEGKKILGVSIQNWWFGSTPVEKRRQIFAELMALVESKQLTPKTGKVYEFSEIDVALKQTFEHDRQGKVILVPQKTK